MASDQPVLGRRTWRGVPYGPPVRLGRRSSLLIVGPTQVGKTSSLVVPTLLTWTDALVVTSVKRDVLEVTRRWRASLGEVQVLEPGRDEGLTWDPLEGVWSLRHALRVARDLTSRAPAHGDSDFWNSLATKLVASLLMGARERAVSIFDVAAVVEQRAFDAWLEAGETSEASTLLESLLGHDPKTLDGVVTTAETMLLPWRFRQPLARVRSVVTGPNTLYLCSPRGEQHHYESLFRGALRTVLEEQQRLVDEGRQRRLLLVLDEAASVAPLEELDQLAATVSGLDVTLVTVLQDFAQLVARWGPRAATIVNNHTTRLVMGGLADPTVQQYLPEIVDRKDDSKSVPLRQRASGTALVIAQQRPVLTIRLRPWWRDRHVRHRGESAMGTIPRWRRPRN